MRPDLFTEKFDQLSDEALERLERIEVKLDCLFILLAVAFAVRLLAEVARLVF